MDPQILKFVTFVVMVVVVAGLVWLPLNWRRKVTVKRKLNIAAPAEEVWPLVAMRPGDVSWHPHLKRVSEMDGRPGCVSLYHEMTSPEGTVTPWQIDLEVERDDEARTLSARRLGLEQYDNLNDRLLSTSIAVREREAGCTVAWEENYGPRSLAGRFVVYSDIDGTLAQLKSFCETGKVCARSARSAGMALSLLSAIVTVCAFALLVGWQMAVMFAVVLMVHELGHLVSFRMIGQPWGRIMFVPFIGGVAVSRVPHKRLADDVFCALMGAGLSLVLLIPAAVVVLNGAADQAADSLLVETALICSALAAAINLLNLLPIFPLDGGRVIRAMVQSFAPGHVRHALFACAGLIAGAAIMLHNAVLTAVAVIAFFQSKRLGPARPNVEMMNRGAVASLGAVYLALTAAHGAVFATFGDVIFG